MILQTNLSFGDRFLFTGREFDAETGLYFYNARYYDPLMGRFVSQDPIGFSAGSVNLYAYAANSPTNHTDPTGRSVISGYVQRVWAQVKNLFNRFKGFLAKVTICFLEIQASPLFRQFAKSLGQILKNAFGFASPIINLGVLGWCILKALSGN